VFGQVRKELAPFTHPAKLYAVTQSYAVVKEQTLFQRTDTKKKPKAPFRAGEGRDELFPNLKTQAPNDEDYWI
jgi:hypothetical protein